MDNQGYNKDSNNKNPDGNKNGKNGQIILLFLFITLAALFVMSLLNKLGTEMTTQRITYTKFVELVKEDKIESVEFTSSQYNITPKYDEKDMIRVTYYTGRMVNDEEVLIPLLDEHGVEVESEIPSGTSAIIYNVLSILLPIALLWLVLGFIMHKMGSGGGMDGRRARAMPRSMWRKRRALHSRMWQDRMRRRSPCRRLWIFSIIRRSTRRSARNCRRERFLWDRRNR